MATRPAGTVIVLRARRAHRPGTPRRRLCRVYTEFTCWRCGKRFTSSVVAVYDPARYRQTEGVGPRVTPRNQVPKWHSTACKRAARRSPLRIVRCARPTCNKIIKTRKPNKKYHSEICRALAYKEKRAAARPPLDPSFEFAIEEAQADALAAMLGIDGPRQEMLDAARRVALEVEAEANARRLPRRPGVPGK